MDSKWFRKIINDNDIPVRGFFRMQNKKNDEGEWYKELIFVDPFIRHGYHRDAKIENECPANENDYLDQDDATPSPGYGDVAVEPIFSTHAS